MKKLCILVAYLVLTFPAYKALRHPGLISGHDSESVLFRSIEFRAALTDGHFPVRWSKRLDYGLGQPTFTFVYNLPFYLSALLGKTGVSELGAYKLILASSFPLSAFFAYLWLKSHFGNKAAFVGGLFYTYTPYHFANVYVRAAFGETVAATLVPLAFYLAYNLAKRSSVPKMLATSLGIAGIALSHNFYFIVLVPILTCYYVVLTRTRLNSFWWWVVACCGGIGLAGYYLVPAFLYKNLTYLSELGSWFSKTNNFLTIQDLLTPRWGFGGLRRDGIDGFMSLQIGLAHLVVLVAICVVTISGKIKRNNKFVLLFMLVMLIGSIFMMFKQSETIWNVMPILKNLQFPWRFMFVVNASLAFCAACVFDHIKTNFFGIGIVFVLLLVTNKDYWHVHRYFVWQDPTPQTIGYPGTLTMLKEETPKWHNMIQEANPHFVGQIQSGLGGEVGASVWKTNYQKMHLKCKSDCVVSFKTHYWPGWEVKLDDKPVELIDPYSDESQGLITFKIPSGQHIAEARLKETSLEKKADLMSIISALIGFSLFLFAKSGPGDFRNFLYRFRTS